MGVEIEDVFNANADEVTAEEHAHDGDGEPVAAFRVDADGVVAAFEGFFDEVHLVDDAEVGPGVAEVAFVSVFAHLELDDVGFTA